MSLNFSCGNTTEINYTLTNNVLIKDNSQVAIEGNKFKYAMIKLATKTPME